MNAVYIACGGSALVAFAALVRKYQRTGRDGTRRLIEDLRDMPARDDLAKAYAASRTLRRLKKQLRDIPVRKIAACYEPPPEAR